MNARAWSGTLRRLPGLGLAIVGLAVGIVLPAQGGGPMDLVNHQPVVYPNGGTSLRLNVDQGPFGTRTNAQALALVQGAIGLWNGVGTATMRMAIGPSLGTDYNASNYAGIFNNYSDGLNPVIFDTDGSLTDAIFGTGAKSSVLGFAGSAYYTSGASAGKYAEGRAVLNGALNVSDATWTVVLAHEFGHFFGLDHSQIDNVQGVAQNNYVLMYPIAYRTLVSLHEDDVAAVTSLYPSASAPSVYGQLQGTFTTAGGTPILGANIWAKEVATGKVYSVVSDYLTQGNGYFRMYLPAGTYTLRAESIDAGFYGGSGVGPYANSSSDLSFQPPHPITPVALGGASAQQIVIVPGCLATAAFRLDGSGSVSGNCGSSSAQPAATTTVLATSANPATAGAIVGLTATITGAAPTGTVSFKDSGASITGCGAVPLTSAGKAICSTSALVAGVHSIVAYYSGDVANATSTSAALSQVINAPAAANTLTNGVPITGLAAAAKAELSYTMAVPAGASNLKFTIAGGTGEANLYVRFGSAPTTTMFDCRPKLAGNNETCAIATAQAGTYYVKVRGGATAFSGVTLTGSYSTSSANAPQTALANGVPVTGLAAAAGAKLRYTMAVPAGASHLTFTIAGGTGEANLYVRFGSAPNGDDVRLPPQPAGQQ